MTELFWWLNRFAASAVSRNEPWAELIARIGLLITSGFVLATSYDHLQWLETKLVSGVFLVAKIRSNAIRDAMKNLFAITGRNQCSTMFKNWTTFIITYSVNIWFLIYAFHVISVAEEELIRSFISKLIHNLMINGRIWWFETCIVMWHCVMRAPALNWRI